MKLRQILLTARSPLFGHGIPRISMKLREIRLTTRNPQFAGRRLAYVSMKLREISLATRRPQVGDGIPRSSQ